MRILATMCLVALATAARAEPRCRDSVPLNQVKVRGSHNSYHLKPLIPLSKAWKYSHPPLDEQLGIYDLRQLELDLHWKGDRFSVYHVAVVDSRTTCSTIEKCLKKVMDWDKTAQDHELVYLMFELKTEPSDKDRIKKMLKHLEDEILDVIPRRKLLTPDDIRRDAKNVREAIARYGWPSYRSVRGKYMLLLEAEDETVEIYTRGFKNLHDRLIFPFAVNSSDPYAVVHNHNDPRSRRDEILEAARDGHLVRTRADAELKKSDSRRRTALQLPVNIVSSDYFRPDDGYWVHLPDYRIWDCNNPSSR